MFFWENFMVVVKPFKAIRPYKEFSEKVASLPYDVMNTEEAKEMAKGNKYSFLHITRSEIDLPDCVDVHCKEVYEKGKENFELFIKNKILFQDESEYFYIYRQIMKGRSQIGLVAVCSVDEYQKEIIKKHEKTRKDKEDDRVEHITTLKANAEPVFLTYKHDFEIDTLFAQIMKNVPEYDFTTNDGIQHTLWVIKDNKNISFIENKFKTIDCMYVADGHHRSAAASRVKDAFMKENKNHNGSERYNFFLNVIFPDNQMYIMDYNRAVKDLNGYSKDAFFKKVEEKFIITESSVKSPQKANTFGMYIDGKWFTLTAKPEILTSTDPLEVLDVSILQNNILAPLLGIDDPRTNKRIDFIGGIRGMEELERIVDDKSHAVAFSMFPTSMKQLMDIADSNKIMPPKSTWFEPKLRSGLFIHSLVK